MSIHTCHKSVDVGSKLEFDYSGQIVNQTACARQRGWISFFTVYYNTPYCQFSQTFNAHIVNRMSITKLNVSAVAIYCTMILISFLGTTVVLENLFSTLPVRHKEFIRNLKREFGKMVQVKNVTFTKGNTDIAF